MIIILKSFATDSNINELCDKIKKMGLEAHVSQGANLTVVGIIGDERKADPHQIKVLDYVEDVLPIMKPYKMVSREFRKENTVINVDKVKIGGKELVLMAGPCAAESKKQVMDIAQAVKAQGANIFRAGAFKPRTSPYSFQGLGEEGLKYLKEAKEKTGLPIITEVMDTKHIDLVAEYSDILQIGARNMQNFNLLKEVGQINKPVFLKRGGSATFKEFLMSAEYIMAGGNHQVILCERGIRTFCTYTRNTLDLNIVPKIKQETHLPIIVDPSHGTGNADLILPMSLSAIAAGADGLMIEVHNKPEEAVSDGDQSLTPDQFGILVEKVKIIAEVMDRVVL